MIDELWFIPYVQTVLLQIRIDELHRDLKEDYATGQEVISELQEYHTAVENGTAVIHMTPKQRKMVGDFLAYAVDKGGLGKYTADELLHDLDEWIGLEKWILTT